MPITLELLYDGRVAVQTYTEPVSAGDMDAMYDRMYHEVLAPAPGKVHIIVDFTRVHDLPRTFLNMSTNMMKGAHSNTGTIIGVVNSGVILAMATIFSRVVRSTNVIITGSMDEALSRVGAMFARELVQAGADSHGPTTP